MTMIDKHASFRSLINILSIKQKRSDIIKYLFPSDVYKSTTSNSLVSFINDVFLIEHLTK